MTPSRSPRVVWAYAYRIVPRQRSSGLHLLEALLAREQPAAPPGARGWGGRLVAGTRTTSILIVSDSLERGRAVSRRLEAGLHSMDLDFSVTEPRELAREPASPREDHWNPGS